MVTEAEARGTLYDGTGKRLSGTGPASCLALFDTIPFKALLSDRPKPHVAVVTDRFYLLSDYMAETKWMPKDIILELATLVTSKGLVGILGRDQKMFDQIVWLISHPNNARALTIDPLPGVH